MVIRIILLFLAFLLPGQVSAQSSVLPYPAPTLLVPSVGARLGQDRAWVGGVAKNNSLIKILVDGQEHVSLPIKNRRSGTASFGVKLDNLALGDHVVTATAQDPKGKTSSLSNEIKLAIAASTPAPTLVRPVVNADAGIEKPFIAGNVHNGLAVTIVIDNRKVATLTPAPDDSGITSFAWQVDKPLALGRHKIEAFASDNGKLGNNSKAVFWQVGEAKKPEKTSLKVEPSPETPAASASESVASTPLTVSEKSDEGTIVSVDDKGKIDEEVASVAVPQAEEPEVKEVSPGAVVRTVPESEPKSGFKLNSSLIVGLTILIFLLLSMLVWYIQEKRDSLGDKVANLFRENSEIGFKTDKLPGDVQAMGKNDTGRKSNDLPPPPPPVF